MATSNDYIEYVCEQMKEWNQAKKNLWRICNFINNKPLFTVFDDTAQRRHLFCHKTC